MFEKKNVTNSMDLKIKNVGFIRENPHRMGLGAVYQVFRKKLQFGENSFKILSS